MSDQSIMGKIFLLLLGPILTVLGLQKSIEVNPVFWGETIELKPANGTVDQAITLCFRALFKHISAPRAPGNKVGGSRVFRLGSNIV